VSITEAEKRPRGRPRLDGLPAGSPQAKKADAKKRAEKEAQKKAKARKPFRLKRIGKSA
jgi:hypothetical protein